MSHYHLYAIGNALVDTEYEVSDNLLSTMGVSKRHMTLIDGPRRSELLAHVQGLHHRRTGGGSAANTAVALAQLGGQAFYSCRVADDELGAFYAEDLAANGVAVASRMIVRPFYKQMRVRSVPVFHGLDRGFALECRLG